MAGTEFSPTRWRNDYNLGTQVVSSLSSPSILTGAVSGVSTEMQSANLSAWDATPVDFSIGVSVQLPVADLGTGYYLSTVSFVTSDLPLTYPSTYIDPAAYLATIAGTYDSGLSNTFLSATVWNGLTSGVSMVVNEIVIVPEPSAFSMAAALGVIWFLGAFRRR